MKRIIFVEDIEQNYKGTFWEIEEVKKTVEEEANQRRQIAEDLQMPEPIKKLYTWFFIHNGFPHDIIFEGTSGERNYLALEIRKELGKMMEGGDYFSYFDSPDSSEWLFGYLPMGYSGLDFFIVYQDNDGAEARQLIQSWQRKTETLENLVGGYAKEKIEELEKQGFWEKTEEIKQKLRSCGATKKADAKYTPDKAGLILVLDGNNQILEKLAYPLESWYTEGTVFDPRLHSRYRETLLSYVPAYKPEETTSKFLFIPSKRALITGDNKIIILDDY